MEPYLDSEENFNLWATGYDMPLFGIFFMESWNKRHSNLFKAKETNIVAEDVKKMRYYFKKFLKYSVQPEKIKRKKK